MIPCIDPDMVRFAGYEILARRLTGKLGHKEANSALTALRNLVDGTFAGPLNDGAWSSRPRIPGIR